MVTQNIPVCDYCLNVAYDSGASTYNEQALLMQEMGADVEDHLCDEVETGGEVKCSCGCRRVI